MAKPKTLITDVGFLPESLPEPEGRVPALDTDL